MSRKAQYHGSTNAAGQKHGFGELSYASGDVFSGHWSNGQKSGHGVALYANGARYDGQWVADKKEGIGRFDFADGSSYAGAWRADRKSGLGIAKFTSGNVYVGHWEADQMAGEGKFLYVAGDTYSGSWVANRKQGFGVWTSADGATTYAGGWDADLRHGDGLLLEGGVLLLVRHTHGVLESSGPAPDGIDPPRALDRSVPHVVGANGMASPSVRAVTVSLSPPQRPRRDHVVVDIPAVA